MHKDAEVLDNPQAQPRRCYWNVINYMYDHGLYHNPKWQMVGGYYGPPHLEIEHFWIKDTLTDQYYEVSLTHSYPPYREDPAVKQRWDQRVQSRLQETEPAE